jgi:undecaprenyl-diphosphatase
MNSARSALLAFEQGACRAFNRSVRRAAVRRLFETVSRLGDGWIWLALAMACSFEGPQGRETGLRMLVTGVACTALYTALKRWIRRPRPFRAFQGLTTTVRPLDEFSFPSGHTMHAVSFTVLAVSAFPSLAWVLVPFTALVGLSRVTLGLHYPSDVLAGAGIGALVANAWGFLGPLP